MNMKMCMAALIICAVVMAGCSPKGGSKDYDVYLFNAKGENAAQVQAMAKAYEAETGVRVKTFSIGAGADQSQPMIAEMNSKNPPSIYSIQGINNLEMWLSGGYVVDLNAVTEPQEFARLAADIPQGLRLTLGGNTSYGIPYNVEGYGYIVDKQMLAGLFGEDRANAALAGLKAASWSEFEDFVLKVEQWIRAPAPLTVTLGGTSYTLAKSKEGRAANLNGIFVMMGSETWTYGGHLVNIPLNAVFTSIEETFNAAKTVNETALRSLYQPLIVYAKTLDFKSSHLAGKNGPAARGQDLVSPANFGYNEAVQIFSQGKALFLKQGNWAYNNIAAEDREVAERLDFVPVKMPFNQADIAAAGMTVDRLNRSIPVFVPNYYAVNAMVSPEEQKAALKFLAWMNTSSTGQRYIVEEMAFIPYNADPATTVVPNSLGNSIISYMKDENTLQGLFLAAPGIWPSDTLGTFVREQYLTRPQWEAGAYERIASFGVDEWRKIVSGN